MRMMTTLLVPIALLGCAEQTPAPIDLDGPRGRVVAPGPWAVRVFSREGPGRIAVRVDDGPLVDIPLADGVDGAQLGILPDAPVGSTLTYFAEVGGRFEPADGGAMPRRVEVVPAMPPAPPEPGQCSLAFRWPVAELRIGPMLDSAPQFGTQLTVIVTTTLADGAAARLTVSAEDGVVGYSGIAGSGVVGFENVTLPAGQVRLEVAATPPGGAACETSIAIVSAEQDGP